MWVRGFDFENKWLSGIMQEAVGAQIVMVETPTVIVRQHADQVRALPTVPWLSSSTKPSA